MGVFVLSGLKDIFGAGNVGLYRADGMAVFSKCSGFTVERLKIKHMLTSNLRVYESLLSQN